MNWKWILLVLVIVAAGVAYFFYSQKTAPVASPTTATSTGFGQPAQYIPPPADQSSASPTTFVTGFYSWYLQGIANDPRFVLSDQYKSAINNWLTLDFISNWDSIVTNTNENPVLLSQDYADSWLNNINASVVSQTSTTTVVLVSLGTSSTPHKLTVELSPVDNNMWRIVRVTTAP